MIRIFRNITLTLAAAALLVPVAQGAVSTAQSKEGLTRLEQDVRHELVMLPWLGVFDNLEFQVNGNEVILSGQVIRPTLRSSAENVVKQIEGVERVTNNIEVLPLSPFDDDIRVGAWRAIYGYGPLSRYNMGAIPSIHIVVKNGNITLEGVVANQMDSQLAYMRARQVPGAFSVTNDLRVENSQS
jgi:hyperosmotically inducible protein